MGGITLKEACIWVEMRQIQVELGIMKTLSLMTFCSILLLSSQSYSQDSLHSGGGDSGESDFGNLNIDVPDEDQQDDAEPSNSDGSNCDESNETPKPNMPPSEGVMPPSSTTNDVSYEPSSYSVYVPIFDILAYIDQQSSPSLEVTEWRIPKFERKGRPSATPRNRIIPSDGVKPDSRPRIVMRGKECPSDVTGNPDDCPGQRDGSYPRNRDECDCCCHSSSSDDDGWLTKDSNSWGQADSHERSNRDSDSDDCDKKDDKSDCDSDDDRESCDENRTWDNDDNDDDDDDDDDDCRCTCDCKYPYGIVLYD